MFRCQITGKNTQPGEKCNKVVIERREKVYTQTKILTQDFRDVETLSISNGWEIVKEINVSDEGLEIWNKRQVV